MRSVFSPSRGYILFTAIMILGVIFALDMSVSSKVVGIIAIATTMLILFLLAKYSAQTDKLSPEEWITYVKNTSEPTDKHYAAKASPTTDKFDK